jgi:hypothetical protein
VISELGKRGISSPAHRRGFYFPVCWREGIESCQDAAFFVWHACQSQAHFDSTQRPCKHQIIETAEVSDPEYFAREFGETGSEGHIKIFEDDGPQLVRVVAFW